VYRNLTSQYTIARKIALAIIISEIASISYLRYYLNFGINLHRMQ